jgi:TonB-linked SusC/RagA family outer membrane protein
MNLKFLNRIFLIFMQMAILCGISFSQSDSLLVTGSIISASTSRPLYGIQVMIPGISSAYTDTLGTFIIQVPDRNATLQVTGPGYQYKEVPLKGREVISVELHDQSFHSVYEPVKLPYSEKAYNTLVFAVEKFENSFVETSLSPEGIIKGKINGLNVISRSGSPGIGANMFLQGFSSLYATNQPLIIVDGMIYDNAGYSESLLSGYTHSPLTDIDIKDIESITVIKDGNSIYGSKSANGVLLINTAHAQEAATNIDFYAHTGIMFQPSSIPVLNASDYRGYLSDQLASAGLTGEEILQLPYMEDDNTAEGYYRFHNQTSWQDEIFTRGYEQNYYLRVTGGDEIARYGLSVGYLNSSGIVKETRFQRYSTRFNADVSITSRFRMNTSLAFTDGIQNLRNDGVASKTSPVYLSLIKSPFLAPYVVNDLGQTTPTLEDADMLNISNPLAIIKNMTGDIQNFRFFGSLGINYNIINDLKFSSLFGVTFDKETENVFIPRSGVTPDSMLTFVAYNTSENNLDRYFSLYNDTRLSYSKSFHSDHNISAMAGFRYNTNQTETDWGKAYNTPSDEYKDLGSGSDLLRRTGGSIGEWKWMSLYAQAGYDYNRKYFMTANISLDGSSRFGSKAKGIGLFDHKFGVFPSVGIAWLISSETFMNSFQAIELLKLRMSYGITGNDDIGNYGDEKYYTFARFVGFVGSVRGNIPDPYIQWETNRKADIGIDLALFNERLKISGDLFRHSTINMLALKPADIISGFDYFLANDGSMSGKGYEFRMETRILNRKIKWDAGFSFAHYHNEIKELPQETVTDFGDISIISREGSPAGLFFGYRTGGVFVSDEQALNSGLMNQLYTGELIPFSGGDVIFDDYNQDGQIDERDRQVIGDPNPDMTGMIFSDIVWKRFAFDMQMTFCLGNDIYNLLQARLESMTGVENQSVSVKNRWKENGQVTDIPRAEWKDPMGNSRFSDRWIEDGSYLRISHITVSYNLPFKNNFIRSAMVYLSANNLFTITDYSGYDPEFSYSASPFIQGIDYGLTPQISSVFLGIRIGL